MLTPIPDGFVCMDRLAINFNHASSVAVIVREGEGGGTCIGGKMHHGHST